MLISSCLIIPTLYVFSFSQHTHMYNTNHQTHHFMNYIQDSTGNSLPVNSLGSWEEFCRDTIYQRWTAESLSVNSTACVLTFWNHLPTLPLQRPYGFEVLPSFLLIKFAVRISHIEAASKLLESLTSSAYLPPPLQLPRPSG